MTEYLTQMTAVINESFVHDESSRETRCRPRFQSCPDGTNRTIKVGVASSFTALLGTIFQNLQFYSALIVESQLQFSTCILEPLDVLNNVSPCRITEKGYTYTGSGTNSQVSCFITAFRLRTCILRLCCLCKSSPAALSSYQRCPH